jgi:cell division protein FtsI (penicillin-binding protein 3)
VRTAARSADGVATRPVARTIVRPADLPPTSVERVVAGAAAPRGGRARRLARRMTVDLRGGPLRSRTVIAHVAVGAVLIGLLLRVAWLQTSGSQVYRDAGAEQRTRTTTIRAERGSILDRTGLELALPVPASTIFVDPREVADPVGTARALAGILGLAPEREAELLARMQKEGSSFAYVARQVNEAMAAAVVALGLPGVASYPEQRRELTIGSLRPLIGRTDPDGAGTAGLELQYNAELRGTDGRVVREVNADGRAIASAGTDTTFAEPGRDLLTTIDRNIQVQVDAVLAQQVARTGALSGTAIVMEVATGEIYALSTVRRNADGTYSADSGNFAAVEAHEPGSVAKVFSISTALNEGAVAPESTFTVPGSQVFDEGTEWETVLTDAYPHGTEPMTVRRILVDSSNLGTVMASQLLADGVRHDYLRAFGFGERTALGFPGESRGLLSPPGQWRGTERFTNAYGYGYATTALQLVAGVNVVANGGTYVAPRIVSGTVGADGNAVPLAAPAPRDVLKPEVAATMRSMLSDVVCFGTGSLAKVPGMTVAGKTGTGYKRQDNGTYVKDDGTRAYFASFVGFLPAAAPEFTVLVSVDEPDPASQDRFGGTAAAPVFASIAQLLVAELGVRPVDGDTGCAKERPAELGPRG